MDELLSGQRGAELHAGLEGAQFQALPFPSKGTFQELEWSLPPSLLCCGPAPLNYIIAYLFLLGLEIFGPSA